MGVSDGCGSLSISTLLSGTLAGAKKPLTPDSAYESSAELLAAPVRPPSAPLDASLPFSSCARQSRVSTNCNNSHAAALCPMPRSQQLP